MSRFRFPSPTPWLVVGLGLVASILLQRVPLVLHGQVPSAHAEEADAGSIHFLAPGPILADGSLQNLAVFLVDRDGLPVGDASFRGSQASVGKVMDAVPAGPGIYLLPYQAPASSTVREGFLTLKARFGSAVLTQKATVRFLPPPSSLTASLAPDFLVLGRGDSPQAILTVTATGPGGGPSTGLRLAGRTTSGTVGPFQELGGGRYQASYRPPTENRPHLAQIAVVDGDQPEAGVAFLSLPLWGSVDYPLETGRANATLVFDMGVVKAGPFQADAAGKVQAALQVPPGVAAARILIESPGAGKETLNLSLNTAPPSRLQMAPWPAYLPANGKSVWPVRFQVSDFAGKPDMKAKISFTASEGVVGKITSLGGGLYQGTWTPPLRGEAGVVTFAASLEGDAAGSRDGASVDLVAVPPQSLSGMMAPWPAGGSPVTLTVQVKDALGQSSLPQGLSIQVVGPGGTALPAPPASPSFTTSLPAGPGVSSVWLSMPASGRVATTLLALPLDTQMTQGGTATVRVFALDRHGLLVAGVPVQTQVLRGTVQVPAAATTDATGVAEFKIASGTLGGPQRVRFSSGSMEDEVLLWQSRERMPGFLAFPPYGGSARAAASTAFHSLSARVDLAAGLTDLSPPADSRAPTPAR